VPRHIEEGCFERLGCEVHPDDRRCAKVGWPSRLTKCAHDLSDSARSSNVGYRGSYPCRHPAPADSWSERHDRREAYPTLEAAGTVAFHLLCDVGYFEDQSVPLPGPSSSTQHDTGHPYGHSTRRNFSTIFPSSSLKPLAHARIPASVSSLISGVYLSMDGSN